MVHTSADCAEPKVNHAHPEFKVNQGQTVQAFKLVEVLQNWYQILFVFKKLLTEPH